MRYIKWCFGQIYDSIRCEKEFDEINKELEGLYKKYELLYRQKMGDINQKMVGWLVVNSEFLML
jgi:hypothetical protein